MTSSKQTTLSLSLQQSCSLIVMCPELHHLSLTNTASPPPFLLPLSFVLSARNSLKPSRVTAVSGVVGVSHVSVNIMTLHARYSLWCRVSAANSSILLGRDLTFPMMMDGRTGLYLLLLARRSAPARLPRLLLFSSWETSGLSWGSTAVLHPC